MGKPEGNIANRIQNIQEEHEPDDIPTSGTREAIVIETGNEIYLTSSQLD